VSIVVPLDELGARTAEYPWGYLLTVGDNGVARCLAVPAVLVDGAYETEVGEGTAQNLAARPAAAMVFPPPDGTGYSLVVDGIAAVDGRSVRLVPETAVLHRPALVARMPSAPDHRSVGDDYGS
jgi:hypothetical protein